MQNNQLLTKSHVELDGDSIDKRNICSLLSSTMFDISDVLSSVYCMLGLGSSLKLQVAPTTNTFVHLTCVTEILLSYMLQSYILEGALADVQERTARYLEMLSGGSLGLLLRPTKLTKGSKVSVEAIDKIAVVRLSNGTLENRSLRQLSGGERRRMVSLLEFMNFLVQVNPLFGLWKWVLHCVLSSHGDIRVMLLS